MKPLEKAFSLGQRAFVRGVFKVKKNPLSWVDGMLGVTHTNFFENKVVDYAKGATTGDWSNIWGAASAQ